MHGLAGQWLLHRTRLLPGCEPARALSPRHRPGPFVRVPTRIRDHPRLGWSGTDDAALCHQCDFAGCVNPAHMRLGTNHLNRTEYHLRRRNLASPLADVRGPAGRTRAIAAAIRMGLADHELPHVIETRIASAEAAGMPLTLW